MESLIEKLIRGLEAAEICLKKIERKNNEVAEHTLQALREAGSVEKWPGGLLEDIAESAQGRQLILRKTIEEARAAIARATWEAE